MADIVAEVPATEEVVKVNGDATEEVAENGHKNGDAKEASPVKTKVTEKDVEEVEDDDEEEGDDDEGDSEEGEESPEPVTNGHAENGSPNKAVKRSGDDEAEEDLKRQKLEEADAPEIVEEAA